jgi:predicted RNase H-like nuclease (RuvC/YqgF family)
MGLNPKQTFIINATTREGIAEDCNNYLLDHGQLIAVEEGDDRLTDTLCEEYARCLSETFYDEDAESEYHQNAIAWLLDQIGIVIKDTQETDKEKEIAQIKLEMSNLQARLMQLTGILPL